MKRYIAAGLVAVGMLAFSATDANAYYYGGYYGGGYSSYYPSYYGNYYSGYRSPGISLNFSYSDYDRGSRYRGGYGHGRHYGGHGRGGHGHGDHYKKYGHTKRSHHY